MQGKVEEIWFCSQTNWATSNNQAETKVTHYGQVCNAQYGHTVITVFGLQEPVVKQKNCKIIAMHNLVVASRAICVAGARGSTY